MTLPQSSDSIRSFLAWTWGGFLMIGGALFLVFNTGLVAYSGPLLPVVAAAVAAVGVPFLGRWVLCGRRDTWALLTAWIFTSLSLLLVVLYLAPREPQLVLSTLLIVIALSLFVLSGMNRWRWWLLLPAYLLLALGGLVALTALNVGLEVLAGAALLMASLPLWLILALSRRGVWVAAGAGLLSVAGAGILVFFNILEPGTRTFFMVLDVTLGAALIALWLLGRALQRRTGIQGMELNWALWLAAGLAGAAALSYWYPSAANWGLSALALGAYIIYRQVTRTTRQQRQVAPPAASMPAATPAATGSSPAAATQPAPPPPTPAGPPPGIEFRPIDPFQTTRPDDKP